MRDRLVAIVGLAEEHLDDSSEALWVLTRDSWQERRHGDLRLEEDDHTLPDSGGIREAGVVVVGQRLHQCVREQPARELRMRAHTRHVRCHLRGEALPLTLLACLERRPPRRVERLPVLPCLLQGHRRRKAAEKPLLLR